MQAGHAAGDVTGKQGRVLSISPPSAARGETGAWLTCLCTKKSSGRKASWSTSTRGAQSPASSTSKCPARAQMR